jgi:hypothetical protein
VEFQTGSQPMRRGPRQSGAFAEFGQATAGLGDRVQHTHRFVEDADAAIVSHIIISHMKILASQIVR